MKNFPYKEFSLLTESILSESSALIDQFRSIPGATEVIQSLHKTGYLGHSDTANEISSGDLRLSAISRRRGGGIILYRGKKGFGALRLTNPRTLQNTSMYIAKQSVDPETGAIEGGQLNSQSFSNLKDSYSFISRAIGPVIKRYIVMPDGENQYEPYEKYRQRQKLKKELSDVQPYSIDNLYRKFQPLFARTILQARASLQGFIIQIIKQGSVDRAKNLINRVGDLDNMYQTIIHPEASNYDMRSTIEDYLKNAMILTAAHYYPTEIGNIRQLTWQKRYDVEHHNAQNVLTKLQTDLANGDMEKMSSLLYFFKTQMLRK